MFRPGDRVKKNPATWAPNAFDACGRGVGVGVVIEPPFRMEDGLVDVRWERGRWTEAEGQLQRVE